MNIVVKHMLNSISTNIVVQTPHKFITLKREEQ